ncbi:MAG TPA: outer membrane lipoprotein carrier protein LolA [Polyangiaceae bacterium]|jgi:outer membrane lipoprotein carrier protein|nr:outer membrane lipoprotein carrier protein LolA [Polyangiaceae bacterium]
MIRRSFLVGFLGLAALSAQGAAFAQGAPAAPKPIAPAKGSPELTADQIAERVQSFYDRSKTFKAGFKQQYRVRAYDKTIDSQGSVVFEKPGKMSWRYTNNGNRVVSDGKLVKVYEKENKQMYEQPLDKSQYPAALSFLVGGGNLRQSFKFTKRDARQMNFEGGYVIVGDPVEASPSYQSIILYVDGTTYQVRRVLLLDAQGNRNRFDFLNPEINTKAPTGEFNFTPPPGTQIIRP